MRAIKINPYDRTVTEIDVAPGIAAIYAAMSVPKHTVELFTVISLDSRGDESVYLDDEGLLQPGRAIWRLRGYPSPLAGCGLVLRRNDEGETIATRVPLAEMAAAVAWTDQESTGEIEPGRQGTMEGPDGTPWPAWIGGPPVLQPRGTHGAGE